MKIAKLPKKTAIIVAAIVAGGLILIGGGTIVVLNGAKEWKAKASTSTTTLQNLKKDVKMLSDDQTPKERRALVNRLAANTIPINCEGSWWYGWQADRLDSGREARKACTSNLQKITALQRSLADLHMYLHDEEKIISILMTLKIDSSQAGWQANAKQAIVKAKQATTVYTPKSAQAKKVLRDAQGKLASLEASWVKLDVASEKQDKTNYMTAVSELKQAYTELSQIADVSDLQLESLVAVVASHIK